MPNGTFVRKVRGALDEIDIIVDLKAKNPTLDGRPVKATYDPSPTPPRVTLYRKCHKSFDDMVVSLLHEAWHHLEIHGEQLPEYLVHEALDRAAFASSSLRWAASKKIGDHLLRYR